MVATARASTSPGTFLSIGPTTMDSSISRRALVRGGLTAAAGFALPQLPGTSLLEGGTGDAPPNRSAEGAMTTLTTYMKEAQTRALPADAAEHTRLHVLDTFAAMISGSALPPGKAALDFIRAYRGPSATNSAGMSTIVASKMRAAPIEAALANAVMAHADET